MQFFSTKDVSHSFLSCNTKEIFCINVRKKSGGGGAIKINFVLNEQNAYAAMNAYADMLHYVYGKKLSFLVWLLPPSFVPGKFLHNFHQILFRVNSSEKLVYTYLSFIWLFD